MLIGQEGSEACFLKIHIPIQRFLIQSRDPAVHWAKSWRIDSHRASSPLDFASANAVNIFESSVKLPILACVCSGTAAGSVPLGNDVGKTWSSWKVLATGLNWSRVACVKHLRVGSLWSDVLCSLLWLSTEVSCRYFAFFLTASVQVGANPRFTHRWQGRPTIHEIISCSCTFYQGLQRTVVAG